ncbi:hypothetical protein HG531_010605 [Fusarium graminearum]|nr:hypothetical protein HG531_010605 [Fusarium graminearum]
MCRMAPGFVGLLLTNDGSKARRPLVSRKCPIDIIASGLINPTAIVLNALINADVIVKCGKLNQLPKKSDGAVHAHILMTYDGLGDSFSLVGGTAEHLEHFHSLYAAIEIERHVCGCEEDIGRSYVV